jgi:hypothetical protein
MERPVTLKRLLRRYAKLWKVALEAKNWFEVGCANLDDEKYGQALLAFDMASALQPDSALACACSPDDEHIVSVGHLEAKQGKLGQDPINHRETS